MEYRKERVSQFIMMAFNKKRKPKHTTSFKYSKNKHPLLIIGYSKCTKRNVKFWGSPNGEDEDCKYIFPRYWNSSKTIFCYSTIGKFK